MMDRSAKECSIGKIERRERGSGTVKYHWDCPLCGMKHESWTPYGALDARNWHLGKYGIYDTCKRDGYGIREDEKDVKEQNPR